MGLVAFLQAQSAVLIALLFLAALIGITLAMTARSDRT